MDSYKEQIKMASSDRFKRIIFQRRRKFVYGIIMITTLIFLFRLWFDRFRTVVIILNDAPNISNKHQNVADLSTKIASFMKDWCQVKQLQMDWERMLVPCRDLTIWGSNKTGWDRNNRTDPETSFITLWDIRPAGEFSRFHIQTQTASRMAKTIGGDSWRVRILGIESLAADVVDFDNGTYEVVFLVTIPGQYQVEATLEYSLCDGAQDPPADWFIKGNTQGKQQPFGILGKDKPYLLKSLWNGSPVIINVPDYPTYGPVYEVIQAMKQLSTNNCVNCNLLWDGHGRWVFQRGRITWRPYLKSDDHRHKVRPQPPPGNKGSVIWFYGDSVSNQFYWGVRLKALCSEYFRFCRHTYNWIYELKGNETVAKNQDDDLDFDYRRVINELRDVISQPIFDNKSAIIVNSGLHYLESTNFSNYQKVIDGIIELFKETEIGEDGKERLKFKGHMIWKSTTALNKYKLSALHHHTRRFLTYQRVLLYNAYANSRMCAAGFPVLDVHPITDSYPHGSGTVDRPNDAVHYEHHVFESVERLLEEYFYKRFTDQINSNNGQGSEESEEKDYF